MQHCWLDVAKKAKKGFKNRLIAQRSKIGMTNFLKKKKQKAPTGLLTIQKERRKKDKKVKKKTKGENMAPNAIKIFLKKKNKGILRKGKITRKYGK